MSNKKSEKEYLVAATGVASILVFANSEKEAIEKARQIKEPIDWDAIDFDYAEEV